MTYQPEDQIDCQTFLGDLEIKGSISITDLCPRKGVQTFLFLSSAIHYITSVHLIPENTFCENNLLTNDVIQKRKSIGQISSAD